MNRDAMKLEGDGVSDTLFELLWTKDALNFSPSVNVPDTIVFRYGQPVQWYFTATNGRVKRKNRQNLMNSKIEEVFTKQVLGYDVIATFVSMPFEVKKGELAQAEHVPRVEYLDRTGLNSFLYKRQKENHGILQRFIEPKSTHNELMRAIWSPKICLIERTQNINQLHDHRHGIYERCVTLEGPDYYVESAPLRGPVLAGQVQNLCETIVSHIGEVTYNQQSISRMVLTLKLDARDKMWLIHSTSIRLYDPMNDSAPLNKRLVNINSVVALPETIHLNPHRSYNKTVAKETVNCTSCAKEVLEDQRYPVTYKNIVNHYDYFLNLVEEGEGSGMLSWPPDKAAQKLIEVCGNIGFGCLNLVTFDDVLVKASKLNLKTAVGNNELKIPPLLRYLHPRLSITSYASCKNDPLFLYKSTNICESCYLGYAEFATLLLRNGNAITKVPKVDPTSSTQPSIHVRPTSADWHQMSYAHRSSARYEEDFDLREDHRRTIENSIGLRTSDAKVQPMIPPPITTPGGAKGVVNNLFKESVTKEGGSLLKSKSSPDVHKPVPSFDQKDIDTSIAERERVFFNQISKNPQLRDHHPLMHLISSQRQLENANISISTSETSSRMEGVFGSVYGRQQGDKFEKYHSYKVEIPYNINGITIRPSKLKKLRRKKSTMKRSPSPSKMKSFSSFADSPDEKAKAGNASSIHNHSNFLDSTLDKIDKEFS